MQGFLTDALYEQGFQKAFLNALFQNSTRVVSDGVLKFRSQELPEYSKTSNLLPRVVEDETHHSALEYGGRYYLKLYRRLDDTINPDLEINRYLHRQGKFEFIPAFRGFLSFEKDSRTELALALLQEKVDHQGSAWNYARDAFARYLEAVETRGQDAVLLPLEDSVFDPAAHEDLPEVLGNLMGSSFPERLIQLGEITAELHENFLSNPSSEDFRPEAFSLHYQRSVYSSFQGLTRRTLDLLKTRLSVLPEPLHHIFDDLSGHRQEILKFFKRIYDHKIDTLKIRTHGDYHLEQVLWTGKDFVIRNFEGEAMRPHSERRLKRSGLRDVAAMLRSLAYVAQVSLQQQLPQEVYDPAPQLLTWTQAWVHYSCRLFLHGYLSSVKSPGLIPAEVADRKALLEIFMMEKAMYELLHELENRPEMALLPVQGIRYLLKTSKE
jgi:maltose alpha-D-glucosyltransferase/alpha-amylase